MPDTHTHIHTQTLTHPPTHTPIRQYQLALHVLVAGRADEDGVLHQAHEAPEGVTLILDLRQQGGHQVGHALAVAHVRVKHGVVQQNPPGGKGWRGEGVEKRRRRKVERERGWVGDGRGLGGRGGGGECGSGE